jgi:hypothetical protein
VSRIGRHRSLSTWGTLRVEISFLSDIDSRFTKVFAPDTLTRAYAQTVFKSFFAGGIHVTSLVAWVSVRAFHLRAIGCLRAPRAGRRQLRRPGLHKQGL